MTKKIDKSNPCGYCKKKYSQILYKTCDIYGNHYNLNQCVMCKAIFLSPRPNRKQLLMAYDDSYYGGGSEKFNKLIEIVLDYFRNQRATLLARYLGKNGKVLDIGCGNGKFLNMLDKKGNFKLYGTEMQGKAAERTSKSGKIKLKIGKLDANDFPHNSFDAITLFQVFEHLTEPKNTLDIVSKIIKPKGILIISFPNIDSFQSRIFKGKWIHLDPPRHLFFFKPNDFFAEMKKYGFNLISQIHYSIEYNPYGMQQSILNCIIKKRDVLYEYLKGNKDYIKDYSKLNLFLQSMFFKITFPIFVISDLFESYFRKGAVVQFVFRKI